MASPPSSYKDAGSATKANIKATRARVFAVYAVNLNAAARYFQLHNKATAPAAADTARHSWYVPTNSILILDTAWFATEDVFDTGLGFAWSTTDTTFTDSATASDHKTMVRYQ